MSREPGGCSKKVDGLNLDMIRPECVILIHRTPSLYPIENSTLDVFFGTNITFFMIYDRFEWLITYDY